MRRITALLLAIFILLGSGGAIGCNAPEPSDEKPSSGTPQQPEEGGDTPPVLVVPDYRDYGRGTVNFSEIVYKRPDLDSAINDFSDLCDMIERNESSFDEQLNAIRTIDDVFFDITTMYTYATVMTKRDNTSDYWNAEYDYISVNYPRFAKSVEELFVASARSEHAESFEDEYFGEGLIEQYADGGSYSDALVELLSEQAALEGEYSAIGTSNVEITMNGKTAPTDEFIAYYNDLYLKGQISEFQYYYAFIEMQALYTEAYSAKASRIFVELVKTRAEIATESGADSYTEEAYDGYGHDYSVEDMEKLLSDITEFAVPLYLKLYEQVFKNYEEPEELTSLHENEILNTLYTVFGKVDTDLSEAYSYMLQHSLYDIAPLSEGRYAGAFTTYFDKYAAPYIFVSTTGGVSDYFTVIHEFGHFFDNYVNNGEDASLDLSEISSQALELLMINALSEALGNKYADHLHISQIEAFLNTLIMQSFYSMAEHEIYKLSYDEISIDAINRIVSDCADKFGFSDGGFSITDIVTVPHIVLYPCYVQSYATSALVCFEMYFAELDEPGDGFASYKKLISRGDSSSFIGALASSGLASPFEDDFVKNIVNRIHKEVYGSDYFKHENVPNAA